MIKIKRPFVISAITLLFSYILLMCQAELLLSALIVTAAAAFVTAAIKRMPVAKVLLIATACFTSAALLFGISSGLTEKEKELEGYYREIYGTVTEISVNNETSTDYIVLSDCTIDENKIHSKIKVYLKKNESFNFGDRLYFTAKQLTYKQNDTIFSYHALSEKLMFNCFTDEDTVFKIKGKSTGLYYSVLSVRAAVSEKLKRALSENSSAIAVALITGNTDNLSSLLSANMRISGISHIFAVSGMHLSLWTTFFFLIMKRKRVSFLPNIAATLFVVFYIIFTGFSPSVMRAGIMLICVFIGKIIKRAADTLNSLCLAGTLLLLYNPFLAGNVSFLLSFTATAAITLWNDYIFERRNDSEGRQKFTKRQLKNILRNIITSVAVILTTLPVTSVFFGYISLLSPLASLIVTPISQLVMILSLAVTVIPEKAFFAEFIYSLTDFTAEIIIKITAFFAEADFMLISVDPRHVLPCFMLTFIICTVIVLFLKNRKTALICLLSGVLVFTSLTVTEHYKTKDETTVFITGSENATSIAFLSNGISMVYGAGGSYKFSNKLMNFLSSEAVLKLDMLFIPGEYDTETENSEYLIEKYLPREIVYNTPTASVNKYSYAFSDTFHIYSEATDDFCMSVISVDDIRIVICPLPSSDFTEGNEIFCSGDILICRENIPKGFDKSCFNEVIVMTKSEKSFDFPFLSTKDSNIKIKIKGDSYAIY